MKIRGILFTVISAFIYGFTPVLASMTYEMGNNALSMTFYRNFFAIPILFILLRYNKIDLRVKKSDLKNIAAVSLFGVAATTVLLYSSYSYIGVGSATTLHFMYPVFVALICRFAFGEKLEKKKIITLVFACIGVLFFIDLKHITNLLGVFMAVASSLTYAFYMVWMEKKQLARLNPYKLSLYIAALVTVLLFIGNMFWGYLVVDMPLKAYVLIIIVALCASFLAAILLQIGIKEIGSSSAAIFCLFEPITSVIIGALVLNEKVTLFQMIGCIIIIFAITYLALMNRTTGDCNN